MNQEVAQQMAAQFSRDAIVRTLGESALRLIEAEAIARAGDEQLRGVEQQLKTALDRIHELESATTAKTAVPTTDDFSSDEG